MKLKEIYRLTIKLFLIYFLIKETIHITNLLNTYFFDKNFFYNNNRRNILILNFFYWLVLLLLYYKDNILKIFSWNAPIKNSEISLERLNKKDLFEFAVLFVGLNLLLYPIPKFIYNFYLIVRPYLSSGMDKTHMLYPIQTVWVSGLSIVFGYIIISNLDRIAGLLLKSEDE